jgi:hypothetical protein
MPMIRKFGRYVDAKTMDFYTPDNNRALQVSRTLAGSTKLYGVGATPGYIRFVDNDTIILHSGSGANAGDINIGAGTDLVLTPSPGFYVSFGTYDATPALASSGFIPIKDVAGNLRKVMIQT